MLKLIPSLFDRGILWQAVKMAIAIGLVLIIVSELTQEAISDLWKSISVPWFFFSVIAFCASLWFIARRYWVILGKTVNFRNVLHVVLYQAIVGNVITTAAGAAWFVGILRNDYNVRITRGLFSLAMARFGDLLVLFLFFGSAAIVLWREIQIVQVIVVTILSLLLLLIIGALVAVFWPRPLFKIAGSTLDMFGLREKAWVQTAAATVEEYLDELKEQSIGSIMAFALYSILSLGIMMLFAYCSLQIFDVRIGVWPVIFVVTFTLVISLVPIQIFGGLGVYDITYLYLYSLFGLERTEFAPVIVGLRVCYYLTNLALLPLTYFTKP